MSSTDRETKIQVAHGCANPVENSTPDSLSPASLPTHARQTPPKCSPSQNQRRSHDLLTPNPTVEETWWTLHPHSAKRTLKSSISCKQDISFVRKIRKGLRFSSQPQPLSFICSPQSVAGSDGSGRDPALCQGLQQTQVPQHPLPPGPPPGHGLPSAHRVSTARPGPAPRTPRWPCYGHRTSGGSEPWLPVKACTPQARDSSQNEAFLLL